MATMTTRLERNLQAVGDVITAIASGTTLRAAIQAGPDAVVGKRVGLRGDTNPGIVVEITPDMELTPEEARYAPMFTEREEEAPAKPEDREPAGEKVREEVESRSIRRVR